MAAAGRQRLVSTLPSAASQWRPVGPPCTGNLRRCRALGRGQRRRPCHTPDQCACAELPGPTDTSPRQSCGLPGLLWRHALLGLPQGAWAEGMRARGLLTVQAVVVERSRANGQP